MDRSDIVMHAKTHFIEMIDRNRPAYEFFERHVAEVERWALKLISQNSEADINIVLLSVWLHDIGRAVGDQSVDHAINSEIEARRFLAEFGSDSETIERVAHCVRAHRCADVMPQSLEGKILAAADSASHMTDITYLVMLPRVGKEVVLSKLDRDFRDISIFPSFSEELTPLYKGWKELIAAYPAK